MAFVADKTAGGEERTKGRRLGKNSANPYQQTPHHPHESLAGLGMCGQGADTPRHWPEPLAVGPTTSLQPSSRQGLRGFKGRAQPRLRVRRRPLKIHPCRRRQTLCQRPAVRLPARHRLKLSDGYRPALSVSADDARRVNTTFCAIRPLQLASQQQQHRRHAPPVAFIPPKHSAWSSSSPLLPEPHASLPSVFRSAGRVRRVQVPRYPPAHPLASPLSTVNKLSPPQAIMKASLALCFTTLPAAWAWGSPSPFLPSPSPPPSSPPPLRRADARALPPLRPV